MAAILAALQALPELLKALRTLGEFLKEQFGDNPAKFIADSHAAFLELKKAKTPDEKQVAARNIAELLKRL
jgi:hypothetical protein